MSQNIVGEVLDQKYRILRRLGGGGFGDVFLGEDSLLGRRVAIKRLKDSDSHRQVELIHEMRSLDQLHHPGIVGFFHHFYEDEELFLVMEYCEGGSLRNRVRNESAPSHTVMQWGRELADALEEVHRNGIVHHDIKPDNILFGEGGAVKIGDFGGANRHVWTVAYVSPEMQRGEAGLTDVRVDVYALGITLLEMLRDAGPFAGMTDLEMREAKMRHDFIPVDMERWLQEVLSRATHPTPELRFQSMAEFSEAIQAKHVNYVFDRGRIQAHNRAALAERHLAKKQISSALKCVTQALFVSPDCVAAIVASGRCKLFVNRIEEAKADFDLALRLNPRVNIQKELGWLNLELGNHSRAISLLTDHLQRQADDFEAYNLLLECFYRTERFEAGLNLAKLMVAERAPGDCFVNNGFICAVRMGVTDPRIVSGLQLTAESPFFDYNDGILTTAPKRLSQLLFFQNYRFGLATRKENSLTIEEDGVVREFPNALVSVGRDAENVVRLKDNFVSRRHCVFVNFANDVWVYDLGSKYSVLVDGKVVDRKAWLDGVHIVTLGDVELKVSSRAGLLV